MISPQDLRDRLRAMPNIRAVARQAGIPDKTVYRTASGETTPNLDTAARILAAIEAIEAQSKEAA